jgi:uncharacterized protein YbdZ (MbtH family)
MSYKVYFYNIPKVSQDGKQSIPVPASQVKKFNGIDDAKMFAAEHKNDFDRVVLMQEDNEEQKSRRDPDKEDSTIYQVVLNHEEQYSIWPDYKEMPLGWKGTGKVGLKADCLAFIKEVWADMRPLSLKKKMEEMAKNPPPPPPDLNEPREKSLIDRLSEGDHPVEAGLRPEKTVKLFKEAIGRNFVHIKFTETRGGTELGLRLDRNACDFSRADFENGNGTVHVEGGLTLNYVKVKCVADIDLSTLEGTGHLETFIPL